MFKLHTLPARWPVCMSRNWVCKMHFQQWNCLKMQRGDWTSGSCNIFSACWAKHTSQRIPGTAEMFACIMLSKLNGFGERQDELSFVNIFLVKVSMQTAAYKWLTVFVSCVLFNNNGIGLSCSWKRSVSYSENPVKPLDSCCMIYFLCTLRWRLSSNFASCLAPNWTLTLTIQVQPIRLTQHNQHGGQFLKHKLEYKAIWWSFNNRLWCFSQMKVRSRQLHFGATVPKFAHVLALRPNARLSSPANPESMAQGSTEKGVSHN